MLFNGQATSSLSRLGSPPSHEAIRGGPAAIRVRRCVAVEKFDAIVITANAFRNSAGERGKGGRERKPSISWPGGGSRRSRPVLHRGKGLLCGPAAKPRRAARSTGTQSAGHDRRARRGLSNLQRMRRPGSRLWAGSSIGTAGFLSFGSSASPSRAGKTQKAQASVILEKLKTKLRCIGVRSSSFATTQATTCPTSGWTASPVPKRDAGSRLAGRSRSDTDASHSLCSGRFPGCFEFGTDCGWGGRRDAAGAVHAG